MVIDKSKVTEKSTMIEKSNSLLPFDAYFLTEKYVHKARVELGETEQVRKSTMKQLRELATNEQSITYHITDEDLIKFLRGRKFNVQRALALMKKYSNYKKKQLHYFSNMKHDVLSKLVKDRVFEFLPYRCLDGCAVLVFNLNNWNPSEIHIDDLIRCLSLFFYHSINDPMTQVNGYKVVFDVKSPGLKHLRYATPYYMFLLYYGTQECFPGRFKGIHIINVSMAFKAAWAILTNFVSDKIQRRLVLHKGTETLLDYFPEKMLPVEFGGSLQSNNSMAFFEDGMLPENLERLAQY
ncbi:hypothetical protein JTE90_028164 [Oedothorax gibbosus]|uniref:CRAL-TRIO domain-containing protein n=1 Tax=Oedothorax gibbosus TaxID=931172 RepID=A0AAV6VA23_9ARAC|nr:hypothetical protein JTE90_028164 [Oedothorax gibbosus]